MINYLKYHSLNKINIMRTMPPILVLRDDVLYAHPEMVARIVIVIQSMKDD